jgi:hypothetical protein
MYNILSLALSLKKTGNLVYFNVFRLIFNFVSHPLTTFPFLTPRTIIRKNKNLLVTEL